MEESNSQLIFEQASPGGAQNKSPRIDTGQIASKRQLINEKSRGLNISEIHETSTPGGQGTSSEYSIQSKEKKI